MRDPLRAIRDGEELSVSEQILLIAKLSFPAILAQISSVIMQYIDASMVGRLGPDASASIGIVSSTTWLVGGVVTAAAMGFSVRVAHKIGAKDDAGARDIVRWGTLCAMAFSLILMAGAAIYSRYLPYVMGGAPEICRDASVYFLIYALTIPVHQLLLVSQGMIQSTGNIRLPSALNVLMCALDVVFNAILIPIFGVAGAALGTSAAKLLVAAYLTYYLLVRSKELRIIGRRDDQPQSFKDFRAKEIPIALKIAVPVAIDSMIMGFAYVAFTRIVSPFGTISLAANSFAITAESLCYMPGFGIGVAATTIVGQCIGARRKDLGKKLGWFAIVLGMIIMGFSGALMYVFAPAMIGILSPDEQIRALGTRILRIEAFVEPFYGASIVAAGVFRGAGETMMSSFLNLMSVWVVRIPLAAFLGSKYGLVGAWIAMASELCVRGILFLIRMVFWNTKKP